MISKVATLTGIVALSVTTYLSANGLHLTYTDDRVKECWQMAERTSGIGSTLSFGRVDQHSNRSGGDRIDITFTETDANGHTRNRSIFCTYQFISMPNFMTGLAVNGSGLTHDELRLVRDHNFKLAQIDK